MSGGESTEATGPELAWGPKADGSAVANAAAAFNADVQAIAQAEALLAKQRAAFRADPCPSLAARHADLERLARALLAQRETVAATISDDFGNRARQESLLAEVFVTVKAIRHAQAHLAQWMAPRPQPVDWLFQPGRAELRPAPRRRRHHLPVELPRPARPRAPRRGAGRGQPLPPQALRAHAPHERTAPFAPRRDLL